MKILHSPAVRYGMVGVVNTCLYGAVVWLCLHINGMPAWLAATAAFGVSMAFQYTANRIFTFRSRNVVAKEIRRYLVMAGFTYVLSTSLVWFMADIAHAPTPLTAIVVAGLTAGAGFLFSQLWVYRQC